MCHHESPRSSKSVFDEFRSNVEQTITIDSIAISSIGGVADKPLERLVVTSFVVCKNARKLIQEFSLKYTFP